jgi:hypothetical protein
MFRSKTERALRSQPLNLTLAISAWLLAGGLAADAAATWVATLAVNDAFANAKLTSDGLGIYPDYRLPPETGCIEASPDSRGFLHAVLNRKFDDGTRCEPAGSVRQYRVHVVGAPLACARLSAAYGGNNVITPVSGGCQIVYTDNPRIRIESVFKKGATSTPFALLTEMYPGNGLNGLSYEIRTLSNVPMGGGGDQRILTYDGQAILWEFGSGRAKAVAEAFDLDFQLSVQRELAP